MIAEPAMPRDRLLGIIGEQIPAEPRFGLQRTAVEAAQLGEVAADQRDILVGARRADVGPAVLPPLHSHRRLRAGIALKIALENALEKGVQPRAFVRRRRRPRRGRRDKGPRRDQLAPADAGSGHWPFGTSPSGETSAVSGRSEERRLVKAWFSTCRIRG